VRPVPAWLALAAGATLFLASAGDARRVGEPAGALESGGSLPLRLSAPPPASPPALAPVIRRVRQSVVRVVAIRPRLEPEAGDSPTAPRARAQVASGVVVDDEGHVVTTARAIAGCISIRVTTPSGRMVPGNLLGLDPLTDLALIRIPAGLVPALPFAPESAVHVGTRVITVAQSYGRLPRDDVGRITWHYFEPRASLIQMSNVIYPGNSGGAVVDDRGRLLGVLIGGLGEVRAADSLAASASARGPAFAVPIDDLGPLVEEMRLYGGVRRGFLGVSIQQGLIDDPEHPGAPAMIGVQVSDVLPGGPAWRAGLRPGDLVIAIDSVQVNSPDELMRRVTTRRPGTAAELLWLRNDREFRATVALGSTPDSVIAATLESATRSSGARGPEIEAELRRLEREAGPATHPPLRPQR
jgi:S1-C subfamily serine protease